MRWHGVSGLDERTRLIAARRLRNLTQTQLAVAIGSTQRAISYYEAEGGNPSVEIVSKIAKTLDTTADALLGLADHPAPNEPQSVDERRIWKRFRQLMNLPEKDRRAVMRMLDSLTKGQQSGSRTTATG